jgi:hypothetical protein
VTRPNLQTVTSLVRSYLDEAGEPITWNDGILIPFANEAQRKVVAILTGAKLLEDEATLTIPAGTVAITYEADPPTGDPVLPDLFLHPMSIYERPAGSSADYCGPLRRRRSRFSTYQRTQSLGEWMWKAGTLRFIGATTDREIRIEYKRRLEFMTDPNAPLEVPGSENAIAWRCVQNAEFSRGNPNLMATAKNEFNEAIAELKRQFTLPMQNAPVRRRPYGYGQGA